jgi:hypothetical protein
MGLFSPFSKENARRGSIMLFAMVGLAVLGITVAEMSNLRKTQTDATGNRRVLAVRDMVVYKIQRAINVRQSLRNSLYQNLQGADPVNQKLAECMLVNATPGTADCIALDAAGKPIQYGFNLYSPETGAGGTPPAILAGTTGVGPVAGAPKPAYYDKQGNPCTNTTNQPCAFEATAQFAVKMCGTLPTTSAVTAPPALPAAPAPTCDRAYMLSFTFIVRVNPAFQASNKGAIMADEVRGYLDDVIVYKQYVFDYNYIVPLATAEKQYWDGEAQKQTLIVQANPPKPGAGWVSGSACGPGQSFGGGGCRTLSR